MAHDGHRYQCLSVAHGAVRRRSHVSVETLSLGFQLVTNFLLALVILTGTEARESPSLAGCIAALQHPECDPRSMSLSGVGYLSYFSPSKQSPPFLSQPFGHVCNAAPWFGISSKIHAKWSAIQHLHDLYCGAIIDATSLTATERKGVLDQAVTVTGVDEGEITADIVPAEPDPELPGQGGKLFFRMTRWSSLRTDGTKAVYVHASPEEKRVYIEAMMNRVRIHDRRTHGLYKGIKANMLKMKANRLEKEKGQDDMSSLAERQLRGEDKGMCTEVDILMMEFLLDKDKFFPPATQKRG